jgi:predicted nuclease with TOPRIM domain
MEGRNMSCNDKSYEEVCQEQIAELEAEVERLDAENNRLRQIQGWLKSRNDELEKIVSSYKAINTIDEHLIRLKYKGEG